MQSLLDTIAAWLTKRRQQRLAIEQCRVRYGIEVRRIQALRAYQDAEAKAHREREDWDLQKKHDEDIEAILTRRATVRDIQDVRFK